jgi:hypothetical protein
VFSIDQLRIYRNENVPPPRKVVKNEHICLLSILVPREFYSILGNFKDRANAS